MRKKRDDEWKRPITECENHMHRAAYLANSTLAAMSHLIKPADEGKPDSEFGHCSSFFDR